MPTGIYMNLTKAQKNLYNPKSKIYVYKSFWKIITASLLPSSDNILQAPCMAYKLVLYLQGVETNLM